MGDHINSTDCKKSLIGQLQGLKLKLLNAVWVGTYIAAKKLHYINLCKPLMLPEADIEKFWDKNKVKVPIEWDQESCVVMLQEYNTQEVLKIHIIQKTAG